MSGRRRVERVLVGAVLCTLLLACGGEAQDAAGAGGSRARWWLAQDSVEPIADLVNDAGKEDEPTFADGVGTFIARPDGDRALRIVGEFPRATVWRFDVCTYDDAFDMRRLYVAEGWCPEPDESSPATLANAELLGNAERAQTHTGPWEIHRMRWLVPTARVALDGEHVYTSWFDLPSIDDLAAGRLYASFALDIEQPGKHTIRIAFDDFPHGVRNRDGTPTEKPSGFDENPLRPRHIASIAIGEDERVRDLDRGVAQGDGEGVLEFPPKPPPGIRVGKLPPRPWTRAKVERFIEFVDPDRGEPWEYNLDRESMGSDNDMDTGKKGYQAALQYAAMVRGLEPDARAAWDDAYLRRFDGLYRFFVFQRNYHPTGYAQNHSAATVAALLSACGPWEGPEARKWQRWGTMICRKRIDLLGRDGGLEWMNEARDYGFHYFARDLDLVHANTGSDLTSGEPFFQNEWRYALHRAPAFPGAGKRPALITLPLKQPGRNSRSGKGNRPLPDGVTAAGTPTDHHFGDVDEVYVREGWSADHLRARLVAGVPFGKSARGSAKRYNWGHVQVNRGSFTLSQGTHDLVLEPGATRTYRKTAAQNNCILVNGVDQWGGGHVYHPRLTEERIPRIAAFADDDLLCAMRADLANAYPPEARATAVSRVLLHLKPDAFVLFDRVESDGEVEWRFHTPFPEPGGAAGRYVLHSYAYRAAKFPYQEFSFDTAYEKVKDVRCEMGFLDPVVSARVGLTDVYYRPGKFPHPPMRHLAVRREGDGPHTLLTAFSRSLEFSSPAAGVFVRKGANRTVILVGPREHDTLETDAHLCVVSHSPDNQRVEVYRFGGTFVRVGDVRIEAPEQDHFVVVENGRIVRSVSTLP